MKFWGWKNQKKQEAATWKTTVHGKRKQRSKKSGKQKKRHSRKETAAKLKVDVPNLNSRVFCFHPGRKIETNFTDVHAHFGHLQEQWVRWHDQRSRAAGHRKGVYEREVQPVRGSHLPWWQRGSEHQRLYQEQHVPLWLGVHNRPARDQSWRKVQNDDAWLSAVLLEVDRADEEQEAQRSSWWVGRGWQIRISSTTWPCWRPTTCVGPGASSTARIAPQSRRKMTPKRRM